MITLKTFIVAGITPEVESIFAIPAFSAAQKKSFVKEGGTVSYLIINYEPKSLGLTTNIEEATLLTEDEAYQFRDTLHVYGKNNHFNTFDVYEKCDIIKGLVEVSTDSAL